VPEKAKNSVSEQSPPESAREPLEPIRIVRRRIECPDGGTVEVDVPVYPPFRFEISDAPAPARKSSARSRSIGSTARRSKVAVPGDASEAGAVVEKDATKTQKPKAAKRPGTAKKDSS